MSINSSLVDSVSFLCYHMGVFVVCFSLVSMLCTILVQLSVIRSTAVRIHPVEKGLPKECCLLCVCHAMSLIMQLV